MASSGVTVQQEVYDLYEDIKFRKKQKAAFFRISEDEKHIIVDTDNKVDCNADNAFDELVRKLPSDDCRYIVFDVAFETKESGDKSQLIFVSWAPDTAKAKKKMIHASSKACLKKELGLSIEWSLNGFDDATVEELACKLKGAVRVEGKPC